MKKYILLFTLFLVPSIVKAASDSVIIVPNGTSNNVTVANQKIEVSTVSVNQIISSGSVIVGTITASSALDVFGGSVTVRGSGAGLLVGVTSFIVTPGGGIGIGTFSPNAVLNVKQPAGTIAQMVEVDTGSTHIFEVNSSSIVATVDIVENGQILVFPDYVFEPGYNLLTFSELRSYINTNHHLPGIISAKEARTNGMGIFAQSKSNLKAIEELYLYVLDLQKQVKELQSRSIYESTDR